jgi:predicted acylesterase/phospholipase RssA
VVFEPVEIDGRHYVDGGVASGTNVDLLLGSPEPLDLVIVVAPMAPNEGRPDSRFYEDYFSRLGGAALDDELRRVRAVWPGVDIIVLRPDAAVLTASRPNPLDPGAALPCFLATLRSMRAMLAGPEVWPLLEKHFASTRRHRSWLARRRSGRT